MLLGIGLSRATKKAGTTILSFLGSRSQHCDNTAQKDSRTGIWAVSQFGSSRWVCETPTNPGISAPVESETGFPINTTLDVSNNGKGTSRRMSPWRRHSMSASSTNIAYSSPSSKSVKVAVAGTLAEMMEFITLTEAGSTLTGAPECSSNPSAGIKTWAKSRL